MAGEGAVEIDDMQPGKSRLGEMPGLRGRIGVEDGRARHLAAHQADAGAAFQIDRGVQDHRGTIRRGAR